MTIIAWDGKSVAADTQEVSGCAITSKPVQKIDVRGDAVYAVSGAASLHKPLIDWVHDDEAAPHRKPTVHDELLGSSVVMFKNGRCWLYDLKSPYPTECFAPDAFGCSSAVYYVIGVMDSGIDARTAVERAIARLTCVGGSVQVVDLNSCDHDWRGGEHPYGGLIAVCTKCGEQRRTTMP